MPDLHEQPPPACRRCGMPVEANADRYDVFEGMHYVCFHYEFEHSGDADVECRAGGCPAAGIGSPSRMLTTRGKAIRRLSALLGRSAGPAGPTALIRPGHDDPLSLAVVVSQVLQATGDALHASSIPAVARTPEGVRDLLRAGEAVVGCEILCQNLHEADIDIPRTLLLRLREAAQRAGVGQGYIEPLRAHRMGE